jgi:hypothetical protein
MSERHPQHRRSLWLAALVTSIAVPVGYAGVVVSIALLSGTARNHEVFGALASIVVVGTPLCMACVFLLGLPLAVYFRSRGWLAVIPACLVGATAGALVFGLLLWRLERESAPLAVWLPGAAFGLAASVVFCAVAGVSWRLGRP